MLVVFHIIAVYNDTYYSCVYGRTEKPAREMSTGGKYVLSRVMHIRNTRHP